MFISDQELETLTGYKRGAEQCKWLTSNGWVFAVDAHGKPRVAVDYCRYRMGAAKEEPRRLKLNFGGV
jgi:hypothetical protein